VELFFLVLEVVLQGQHPRSTLLNGALQVMDAVFVVASIMVLLNGLVYLNFVLQRIGLGFETLEVLLHLYEALKVLLSDVVLLLNPLVHVLNALLGLALQDLLLL